MKTSTNKEEKIKHERLMKLVKKAEKEAAKFVQKNAPIEKSLQVPRTALYS